MNNLVTSFAHYAGQTADRMGIPKEDKIVRACVELMFNVMSEQGSVAAISHPLKKNMQAVEETINWIGPRYEALKKYIPDFFKDAPQANLDAVTVALLCTGYTHMAHVIADNNGNVDQPTVFKNDTIPWDVLEKAEDIIDDAENIATRVTNSRDMTDNKNCAEPTIESTCVAYAFLSDMLSRTDEGHSHDNYSLDEFEFLMNTILLPIRNYVRPDKKWGKDIIDTIDKHEKQLRQRLEKLPLPEPKKFVPTLVYSAPSQPS